MTEWGRSSLAVAVLLIFNLSAATFINTKPLPEKYFRCLGQHVFACTWLCLSADACSRDSLRRILLCKGAIYEKRGVWRWGRTAVVQKEWLAHGQGHRAGRHAGGHQALHRKPRPGASRCHAATALPLLPVSHCVPCNPWFRNSKTNTFSSQNFRLIELSSRGM